MHNLLKISCDLRKKGSQERNYSAMVCIFLQKTSTFAPKKQLVV